MSRRGNPDIWHSAVPGAPLRSCPPTLPHSVPTHAMSRRGNADTWHSADSGAPLRPNPPTLPHSVQSCAKLFLSNRKGRRHPAESQWRAYILPMPQRFFFQSTVAPHFDVALQHASASILLSGLRNPPICPKDPDRCLRPCPHSGLGTHEKHHQKHRISSVSLPFPHFRGFDQSFRPTLDRSFLSTVSDSSPAVSGKGLPFYPGGCQISCPLSSEPPAQTSPRQSP